MFNITSSDIITKTSLKHTSILRRSDDGNNDESDTSKEENGREDQIDL